MRDTGEATAEYIVRKTFFESYQKQNIANVAFDTDTKKHELTVYVKTLQLFRLNSFEN